MWTTLETRNIEKNYIDQCLTSTKYIMCLTSTNDIMSSILFLGLKSNVNQAGIEDQTEINSQNRWSFVQHTKLLSMAKSADEW